MNVPSLIVALSVVAVSVGFLSPARSEDASAAIYSKGKKELEVQSIKRIWAEAPHNAFPDLASFQGKWFVSLREGTVHGVSGFGRTRIISSTDGEKWHSVALFDGFGDYRSMTLSVTPDNRLLAMAKFNTYVKADAADKKDSLQVLDHQGKTHEVVLSGNEDRVAFSKDGVEWTAMQAVRGAEPRSWLHSGVQWHKGVGYALDRQLGGRSTLYRTKDGLNFDAVSKSVPAGNESHISFLPDDTMIVIFRNGSLATSRPPYQEWALNETNKEGVHSHAGPCILALPSGEVWAACRYSITDRQAFDVPAKENRLDGTALFKLAVDKLVPKLLIPGGGDRGYSGLAWRDGFLWMAYNAPSPETGKSGIYFAKIKLVE